MGYLIEFGCQNGGITNWLAERLNGFGSVLGVLSVGVAFSYVLLGRTLQRFALLPSLMSCSAVELKPLIMMLRLLRQGWISGR